MKRFIISAMILFFCSAYALEASEKISGTVYNADTGKPAAGVTVGLRELNIVTQTDSLGEFVFTGIEKGFYELTFSHQEYGNDSEKIRVKRTFYIVKKLTPKAFDAGNRTKIYGDPMLSRGECSITQDDIKKYPMRGAGDSLHLLQSLPGIGGSFSFAAVPIIRGTNPLFNKYYIDDIPLDYPFHYAAGFIPLLSSINEEAIESVHVIKGNAPLWTADNLGNTVMIKSADAEKEGVHGKMILDPLIPLIPTFAVSIVPNDRLSIIAVGRRTTPDLLIDMNKAHFYLGDYFLKASYILNDSHRITALITGSQDKISFNDLSTQSGYFANGITWEFRAIDDLMLKTVLSNQNMIQSLKNKKEDDDSGAEIKFNPDQYRILQMATLSLKDINIRAGYEAVKYSGGCSGNTSLGDIAGTDFYKGKSSNLKLSFPIEGSSLAGFAGIDGTVAGLYYDAGVKYEDYGPLDDKAFSYTLNVSYQINGMSSVYLKHGTYFAHPDVYYYLGNIDPDFKLAEAKNFAVGMNLIPQKSIFLNAEVYYSKFDNLSPGTILSVEDDDVIKKLMQLHPYSKEDDGNTFGIELSGRGSFKGFDGWLSYAFSRTMRNTADESSFRSDYEQAHLLRIVLSRTWRKWSAALIWNMSSSLPYTPVSRFLFDGSSYTTEYGKRNSANFAMNKRLDVRGTYRTDNDTRISVECWNVLFFRNNTVALETNTSSTERKYDTPFFIWCSLEKPL
ncbi:MAG: carboxypeptidase-like regulatory domain-containing protein [Spirochaetes bacterium]|nr:carboxypeptidase-like regulatory domain-containing protein [Spirochaetota bacterium]